jgi:hypothetical protein
MPTGGKQTSLTSMAASFTTAFQANGLFSPGLPPTPATNEPIRVFDLHVGQNLLYTPRAYESFSFAQLRAFSNVELVRLAIETRKDQFERLDWQIRPKNRRERRDGHLSNIKVVEKFLRKPDGVNHFATWVRLLLEDLLVVDAPTLERRRTRSGKLLGLDVVDGTTIKILVDDNGRRPRAPLPAYQQVIKGRIWNDLSDRDIIYAPRNLRPGHVYGYAPVEQVIVTLNTALRRQTQQLAYFTEGNIPAGLINVPEGWSPDQLKEWQDWMDAKLSGNQAERSKLLWAPFGSKYQGFKEAPIKDEFDEWLARVVCFAFSIPPSPFIKQMNRATSETDKESALEEGIVPLQLWVKRVLDDVIQSDLGFDDLEFAWSVARDVDAKKQSEIHDIYLRNATYCIDDVLLELGKDPLPEGLGEVHRIYTGKGTLALTKESQALKETEASENNPKETSPSEAD